MKTTIRLILAAFVMAAFNLTAATLYVSLESSNPVVRRFLVNTALESAGFNL